MILYVMSAINSVHYLIFRTVIFVMFLFRILNPNYLKKLLS